MLSKFPNLFAFIINMHPECGIFSRKSIDSFREIFYIILKKQKGITSFFFFFF